MLISSHNFQFSRKSFLIIHLELSRISRIAPRNLPYTRDPCSKLAMEGITLQESALCRDCGCWQTARKNAKWSDITRLFCFRMLLVPFFGGKQHFASFILPRKIAELFFLGKSVSDVQSQKGRIIEGGSLRKYLDVELSLHLSAIGNGSICNLVSHLAQELTERNSKNPFFLENFGL